MRDSAIVTIEHVQEVICRESDGIISLAFVGLERPDQDHLLKKGFPCKRSLWLL